MPEEEELIERMERLEGEVGRLAGAIGVLAAELRERISPEAVAEMRTMVEELTRFHEMLIAPWRKVLEEELTERRLWERRVREGTATVMREIIGKDRIYKTFHYLPTCEESRVFEYPIIPRR